MEPTSLTPRAPAPSTGLLPPDATTSAPPPGAPPPPPGVPPGPTSPPPAAPIVAGGGRIVVAVAAGALAMAVVWRTSLVAVAGSVLVVTLAAGLLLGGRPLARSARHLLAAAVVVGAFLAVRTSPWVLGPDLLAVVALLVAGATVARGGRLSDVALGRAADRIVELIGRTVTVPAFLVRCTRRGAPTDAVRLQRRARVRGAALAIPASLAVVVLLASGDAVFASLVRLPVDVERLPGDLSGLACGALVAGALARQAVSGPHDLTPGPDRPLTGRTEATWVLTALLVPLAAFAAVQGVAAAGGAGHVLETEGLTYAEYAREGFFSLLAASALVLTVVLAVSGAVRGSRAAGRRQQVVLAEAVLAMTLGLVAVSVRRLALYEAEFGATMLRLSCTVVALFLGAVLVAAGAWVAGAGRRRWFPFAVGVLALVTLVAWNAVDPERVVVDRNLDRALAGRSLDVDYLERLSDDGFTAIVDRADELPDELLAEVRLASCGTRPDAAGGGLAWNRSTTAAREAWTELCRS